MHSSILEKSDEEKQKGYSIFTLPVMQKVWREVEALFHTSHLFSRLLLAQPPILNGGDMMMAVEYFPEIAAGSKASFQSNIQHTFSGSHQKLLGPFQADGKNIFHRGNSQSALKQPVTFPFAQRNAGRKGGYR